MKAKEFGRQLSILIIALAFYLSGPVFAQTIYLDLTEPISMGDKHVYGLNVNPYTEDRINEISGEKFNIYPCKLTCNGAPLDIKSCKIRGHTTLHFRRKSFSVSFLSPVLLGEKKIEKLAFNYLIRNGDYTDELFLYLTGKGNQFQIIPWDYDDIFQIRI